MWTMYYYVMLGKLVALSVMPLHCNQDAFIAENVEIQDGVQKSC
jgi:hypothetical protein